MSNGTSIAAQTGASKWVTPFVPMTLLALMWWFAGWTGEGQSSAASEAAWLLITASWPALLWIIAAIGIGLPLRTALLKGARDAFPLQVALGIAALMFLGAALGSIGAMQFGGSVGAWILTIAGCALAIGQFARWLAAPSEVTGPPLLVWTCLPALAVLFVAACSAPGWLWSTEFGGYDALSYHLQLPKEWFALGAIKPLEHNVYSFLPGYVEAAFYHVNVLSGGAIESVYACQLLHAVFALIAAWITGRIANRIAGRTAGAIAMVIMLGTPWVIVVGSLGYNEMAAAMMLAAGMLLASDENLPPTRRATLVSVFAASACTAKLTSIGFTAVPLGVLLLCTTERRMWLRAVICGAIGGSIVLLPWLVRNALAVGNPLFPFATEVFGLGHWTAEQASVWARGHQSDASFTGRAVALWNQFFRFGFGETPTSGGPGEPWKTQWLILPWLALFGLVVSAMSQKLRRWSALLGIMLTVQIAFWLGFTHLQSRFLLPAVVPMSVAAALGITSLLDSVASARGRRALMILLALGLIAWCSAPAAIFRTEAGGAPAAAIGAAAHFTGGDLRDGREMNAAGALFPSAFVNHALELPLGERVLLIGEAAPLYFDIDRVAYSTVWDRGPLSQAMRNHPNDPAAWARELRSRGFTHLLINPGMLDRWQRSGWNDPQLTAETVLDFAEQHGRLRQRFPRGELLYELTATPTVTEKTP